jgi:hypothetical protein
MAGEQLGNGWDWLPASCCGFFNLVQADQAVSQLVWADQGAANRGGVNMQTNCECCKYCTFVLLDAGQKIKSARKSSTEIVISFFYLAFSDNNRTVMKNELR